MPEVDVTIVVCTYNRADLLRGALESLAALRTFGRWRYEIVVVDNASTDDTSRVIEAASRRTGGSRARRPRAAEGRGLCAELRDRSSPRPLDRFLR